MIKSNRRKTTRTFRSIALPILFGTLLSACGSGGSDSQTSNPTPPPPQPTEPTPPSPPSHQVVDFDFARATEGAPFDARQIQTKSFNNSGGHFLVPLAGQSLTGNLTLSVSVDDPDGIAAVYVGFNDAALALNLMTCSNNCSSTFHQTLTGINPTQFGGVSGEQLLQLWVDDNLGNRNLVDSVSYHWQEIRVTGVSGTRGNNAINLGWNSLTNYFRYNVYVASEPGVNPDNYRNLADGQAFLALQSPSINLTGKEDVKTFYTMVTAVDGTGESAFSDPTTFLGLADAIDLPPTAGDDFYSMDEDTSLTQNVLGNDSDLESESLTIGTAPLTPISNGTLTISNSGSFTYTPNKDFSGRDGFIYQITDGVGNTDSGIVTITVNQANDPPVPSFNRFNINIAANKNVTRAANELTVDVPGLLINDLDIDSAVLTVVTEPVEAPTQGILVLNADGSFLYTPNAGATGQDRFTYQTVDASGALSEPSEVTITFNATSFPPRAANDRYELLEDQVFVADNSASDRLSVISNDTDEDDVESLTMVSPIVKLPENGTLSMNADGTFSYTPKPGYFGVDSFIYQITDSQGNIAQAAAILTVIRTNTTPNAIPDDYRLDEDTTLTVNAVDGLLSNDRDADFDPLAVSQVVATAPQNGVVTLSNNGSFTYTPQENFAGLDSFRYTVSDDSGASAQAIVRLTVTNVNDPPIAIEDGASTEEGRAVNIDVLANDSDPENDTLTITTANVSANQGTVQITTNNTLTYTPRNGFSGVAEISYRISDGNGGRASANVLVNVGTTNQNPIAVDDSYSVNEDQVLLVNSGSGLAILTANDSDPDGDNLSVTPQPVSNVTNGTLNLTGSGNFSYTPNQNFFGTDSFQYQLRDGRGGRDIGTVTITVNPVNDAPVANNDSTLTSEDVLMNIDVLANDSDADGDPLSIVSASAQNGTATVNTDNTLNYLPDLNFVGVDLIDYSITDGSGAIASATVEVTVVNVNDAPVAFDDFATTIENTPVTVDVLANDNDPDGDPLIILFLTPLNGSAQVNGDNTVTFTPAQNFVGTASVLYTVSDEQGGTDEGNLSIEVTSSNTPPIANNDAVTIDEDTTATIDALANDSDPQGDPISIIDATADIGDVSIGTNSLLTYTPPANFNGTATITYIVADNTNNSSTATVTVTVTSVNDLPIANNDAISTAEDTTANINVLANDSDVESALTVILATATNGSVTILPDQTLNYVPNNNFNGGDIINYAISDGQGGEAQALVEVTVVPVNDLPLLQADTATTDEDTEVIINVLANDSDVESETLTVTNVTMTNGVATVLADQQVQYTPGTNFNGNDTITYTAQDGDGGVSSSTVTVTVNAVNDAPTVVNDTAQTNEEVAITIEVLANDSDVEGDTLTVTLATAENGNVEINPNNTLTYTPKADFLGEDVIDYTVTDGKGGVSTGKVIVEVFGANDAPVAVDDTATTLEDTLVNIKVLENDTDIDSPTLTITEATAENGEVLIKSDGTLDYTPKANYNGSDIINYSITDNELGNASAKVSVTITAVNDAPVAQDDVASTAEDTSVTIDVLANDSDVDDEVLVVTVVNVSSGGAVSNPDNSITLFPHEDFFGEVVIDYSVADSQGLSANAKVTVTVDSVNDAPLAVGETVVTQEDSAISINLLANDSDADGDNLTLTIDSEVNGTVTSNIGGTITFAPTANFSGQAQVGYSLNDGNGGTASAIATIEVAPVNDAPVAQTDSVTTEEDVSNNINVLANDSDADGDPLTITSANANHGQVTIASNQTLDYTPNPDFSGEDVINYSINDGNGGVSTSLVNVTITPVNDAPVAVNDKATVTEDVVATIDALANDSDPDTTDTLRIISATSPNGAVSVIDASTAPQLNFVPTLNFNGETTISYTIADTDCTSIENCGVGHTASATVNVTVSPVNDTPVVTEATASVAENAINGHSVTTVQASDVDDTSLQYAISSGNTDGVFAINSSSGEITVADRTFLNFETTKSYSLSVSATDSSSASGFGQITINVTEVAENVSLVADTAFGNTTTAGQTASNAFAHDNQDSVNDAAIDSTGRVVMVGSTNQTNTVLTVARFNSSGQLDQSFGVQGIFTRDLGSFETATAVAFDSNNNVYVAGEIFNGSTVEYLIIKFLSTGTIDSSFGTSGIVTSNLGKSNVQVSDILVHSDGTIALLAGVDNQFSVYKHSQSDGSLQTSVTINMTGEFEVPTAMAEQSDGKVVIVGYAADSNNSFNHDFAAARIDYSSMTLDTGFATNGITTFDLGKTLDDKALDVKLTTSQDIVMVGSIAQSTDVFDVAVAVLTSTGTLKSDVGTGGISIVDADGDNGQFSNSAYATGLALDASGNMYISLQLGLSASDSNAAVAKLTSSAALDSSFGSTGVASQNLNNGENNSVAVMLDSRARPVLATSAPGPLKQDAALTRFTTSGAFDSSFGNNGFTVVNHTPSNDTLEDGIELKASSNAGKFVYTGAADGGNGVTDLIVARYNSTGSLDTSFANSGYLRLSNNGTTAMEGRSVAELSDGRTVIVGVSGEAAVVVLLDSNGRLDTSFDSDGIKTLSAINNNLRLTLNSVAVDSNNQILFAGFAQNITNDDVDIYLGKLTTSGSFNSAFGSSGEVLQNLGASEGAADMALLSDGSIIIVGTQFTNENAADDKALIAKFQSNGSLDTSGFAASNGYRAIDTNSTATDNQDILYSVAIASDGTIYGAGASTSGSSNSAIVVSLSADGNFNNSFSSDGIQSYDFNSGSAARSIALDSSGKLLMTGVRYNATGGFNDAFITRIDNTGALDVLFNNGSQFDVHFNNSDDAKVILALSNGSVMIAGDNQLDGYSTRVWYLRVYKLVQ